MVSSTYYVGAILAVALVNAPHGDYVFCEVTKNQEDTVFDDDNEGYQLMRDVSRTCFRHFEPDCDWEPAEKVGEWNRCIETSETLLNHDKTFHEFVL